jgi:hypothetical protein
VFGSIVGICQPAGAEVEISRVFDLEKVPTDALAAGAIAKVQRHGILGSGTSLGGSGASGPARPGCGCARASEVDLRAF